MKAGEFCNREVVTVGADESLAGAARLMASQHVGCLVVVRRENEMLVPTAIVTDRDLVVRALATERGPTAMRVWEVASSNLLTVEEFADMDEVVQRMRAQGVRRVPVVVTRLARRAPRRTARTM